MVDRHVCRRRRLGGPVAREEFCVRAVLLGMSVVPQQHLDSAVVAPTGPDVCVVAFEFCVAQLIEESIRKVRGLGQDLASSADRSRHGTVCREFPLLRTGQKMSSRTSPPRRPAVAAAGVGSRRRRNTSRAPGRAASSSVPTPSPVLAGSATCWIESRPVRRAIRRRRTQGWERASSFPDHARRESLPSRHTHASQ